MKVEELEKYALELVTGQHYDRNGVQTRLVSICNRRDRLKEATASRKRRLNESRLLQQFLRNMYEVNTIDINKLISKNINYIAIIIILGRRMDNSKTTSSWRRKLQGPYEFTEKNSKARYI